MSFTDSTDRGGVSTYLRYLTSIFFYAECKLSNKDTESVKPRFRAILPFLLFHISKSISYFNEIFRDNRQSERLCIS